MRDYFDDITFLHNFPITKKEVRTKNHTDINSCMELLQSRGKNSRGSLILSFDYGEEAEIFENYEICEYVCQLFIRYPSLFYYLLPISEVSVVIAYCLLGMKVVMKTGNQMGLKPGDYVLFRKMEKLIIQKTLDFGKEIGDEDGARKSLEGLGLPIQF